MPLLFIFTRMSQSIKGKIDETELIARLKLQEKIALQYLYDHYSSAIYGVVLRIVQDEKVAEEVLQDAFMKVWNNINSYDPNKGRLFTWMLNISRNLAIDKIRSKEIKKANKTYDIEDNVYQLEGEYLIHQNVDGIGLKEVLVKLRDEEKVLVEAIYFKGYTQAEISKKLDVPLGTVKTRLRMALIKLRKELGVE